MHRPGAQGVAVGRLHDLAQVHHRDSMTDVRHRRQVVADEEIAYAEGPLQVLELVDDLRAYRHVERRDRLVEHDEPRVRGQGPRDRDALPLATAELVREQRRHVARQADQLQHLAHPRVDRRAREIGVDLQRLGDDVAHAHARTERAERILEDHLDRPPVRHELGAGEPGDVSALEQDRARGGGLL
jgi:pyruvate/2-oxoglutarate dehydrogenase complex dihydrolipoamide acyltransferase (E2) component